MPLFIVCIYQRAALNHFSRLSYLLDHFLRMTDATRVPAEEIARREPHMQAQIHPHKLHDPYTWAHHHKAAAIGFASCMFGRFFYGRAHRQAWHFGLATQSNEIFESFVL